MKDEYISSLVGRAVQVYKGGPDSNNGILLDVNDDYFTLQKENDDIIYYKTEHIKSIRENSQIRFNSILKVYDSNNLLKAATFNELVVNFKDQTIRINGNGPESKVGKLIDVKDDFFVLYTKEEGLIFYKEQHIKSLSHGVISTNQVVAKDGEKIVLVSNSLKEEVIEEDLTNTLTNIMEVYNQITADNTGNLLTNLKLSWIKVNRKGPESIEGLLVEANENYLVLIVNNEIFRIPTYHVKNFSVSINKSQEQANLDGNTFDNNTKITNEIQSNDHDSNKKLTFDEELNRAIKRRNKHLKKKARKQKQKLQQQESNLTEDQSSEKNPEGQQTIEKPEREESPNITPTNTAKRRKKRCRNQPKKSLMEEYRKNKK